MLNIKTKIIKDPVETSDFILRSILELKNVPFEIPEYLIKNKDKAKYQSGFLNEVYSLAYPDMSRIDLFETLTKRFHIFIDMRCFQKYVKEYTEKKYSVFIIKK